MHCAQLRDGKRALWGKDAGEGITQIDLTHKLTDSFERTHLLGSNVFPHKFNRRACKDCSNVVWAWYHTRS